MKGIEKMCCVAIRKTCSALTEPEAATLFSRLSDKIGVGYLARRRRVNPNKLLRHGWSAHVVSLFNLGNLEAFALTRTSLDRFRKFLDLDLEGWPACDS